MPKKTNEASSAEKKSDTRPSSRTQDPQKRKSGYAPRAIVAYPQPLWTEWEDPEGFSDALDLHMRRHGDTGYGLRRAVCSRSWIGWQVSAPPDSSSLPLDPHFGALGRPDRDWRSEIPSAHHHRPIPRRYGAARDPQAGGKQALSNA